MAATGGDKILANILTFLTGVALILTAFIAGLIATSYGRRPITLIGYAIIILLLVIIGTHYFNLCLLLFIYIGDCEGFKLVMFIYYYKFVS